MALGISQEQLGHALGLTFQQIQKYEKGQNRIGAGRLFHIAEALSAPVSYFYEGLPTGPASPDQHDQSLRDAEIRSLLSSPEGQALCAAFLKIPDAATRRRIVALVSSIASHRGA